MRYIFTSANTAYLPNARILARSVAEHDPGARFVLLLNDRPAKEILWEEEPFDEVFFAHWLPIPNFKQWAFQYSVVELCTATKGTMAEYLFANRNASEVVYLDPDTVMFSYMHELENTLKTADVVLTPHLTDPEESTYGIWSHEMAALKHGTFNLGFFAIKNSDNGRRFLRWWADRLRNYSHIDFNAGLFTDQKWANLAPYLFDGISVLRDRNYNVATWNMRGRKLGKNAKGAWEVNGTPLRFYHFSGFGHDFAWANKELEKFEADEHLKNLWTWYKGQFANNQLSFAPTWHWGCFESGEIITAKDRKRYREIARELDGHIDPYKQQMRTRLRA